VELSVSEHRPVLPYDQHVDAPSAPASGSPAAQVPNAAAQPNEEDNTETRLYRSPAIIVGIDRAITFTILMTLWSQPVFNVINTVGGLTIGGIAIFLQVLAARASPWNLFTKKEKIAQCFRVLLICNLCVYLLAAAGLGGAIDYALLIAVAFVRPTEPVFAAMATFSYNSDRFTKHTRNRTRARLWGNIVAAFAAWIVSSSHDPYVAMRIVYAASAMCYGVAALSLSGWCSRVCGGCVEPPRDPCRLFDDAATAPQTLISPAETRTPTLREQLFSTYQGMIRYYLLDGFAMMYAENMLLAFIVYYAGRGRTGSSVLAIVSTNIVALTALQMRTFKLSERGLIIVLKLFGGLSALVLGCLVPQIESEQNKVAEAGYQAIWELCLVLPFAAIAFVADSPILEAARATAPEVIGLSELQQHSIHKIQATTYQKVFQAQNLSEMLACVFFSALLPANTAWRMVGFISVGVLVPICAAITDAFYSRVMHETAKMKYDLARASWVDSTNGFFCCWKAQPDSYQYVARGDQKTVVSHTFSISGADDEKDDGAEGEEEGETLALSSPRKKSKSGSQSDTNGAAAAVAAVVAEPAARTAPRDQLMSVEISDLSGVRVETDLAGVSGAGAPAVAPAIPGPRDSSDEVKTPSAAT
jgi:hypothetical protein